MELKKRVKKATKEEKTNIDITINPTDYVRIYKGIDTNNPKMELNCLALNIPKKRAEATNSKVIEIANISTKIGIDKRILIPKKNLPSRGVIGFTNYMGDSIDAVKSNGDVVKLKTFNGEMPSFDRFLSLEDFSESFRALKSGNIYKTLNLLKRLGKIDEVALVVEGGEQFIVTDSVITKTEWIEEKGLSSMTIVVNGNYLLNSLENKNSSSVATVWDLKNGEVTYPLKFGDGSLISSVIMPIVGLDWYSWQTYKQIREYDIILNSPTLVNLTSSIKSKIDKNGDPMAKKDPTQKYIFFVENNLVKIINPNSLKGPIILGKTTNSFDEEFMVTSHLLLSVSKLKEEVVINKDIFYKIGNKSMCDALTYTSVSASEELERWKRETSKKVDVTIELSDTMSAFSKNADTIYLAHNKSVIMGDFGYIIEKANNNIDTKKMYAIHTNKLQENVSRIDIVEDDRNARVVDTNKAYKYHEMVGSNRVDLDITKKITFSPIDLSNISFHKPLVTIVIQGNTLEITAKRKTIVEKTVRGTYNNKYIVRGEILNEFKDGKISIVIVNNQEYLSVELKDKELLLRPR